MEVTQFTNKDLLLDLQSRPQKVADCHQGIIDKLKSAADGHGVRKRCNQLILVIVIMTVKYLDTRLLATFYNHNTAYKEYSLLFVALGLT